MSRIIDLTERGRPLRPGARPPLPTPYVVLEFRPITPKGSLLGFAVVDLGNGLVLHDVSIHRLAPRAWASPPARTLIDADGSARLDADGKRVLVPTLTFASASRRLRFEKTVILALREAFPDALRSARPARRP